jgi:hypothetical protein
MRFLKWIVVRIGGPWAGHAVIGMALVLALPALRSPLFIDEYVQAAKWRADQASLGSFLNDCFVFGSADQTANQRDLVEGLGAWWTAPDFKIAFWRPLSAVTHAIDLSLWPGNAVLMHVHTLLWFVVLLLYLNALLRRFLTPRVASLALALYAWDDARGQVLSWISKRNVLIAGVFGICTIIAYDKWRRDGWRLGAWLGPMLLAAGLLSAEMAIATTGFLFAHALWLDKGSLGRRIARLTPYLLVVVIWQAAYLAGGYGVQASAGYVDPLHEPLSYVAKLFVRAPILSLQQLTPIVGDLWGIYPSPVKVAVYLLAVALLIVVARIAWPRVAADPQSRFWLLGAGLSLVPICATGPQDQNLVFVGFGVAPALAMLFASAVDSPPDSRMPRLVIGALAVFNLALAPLLLPAKSLTMLGMGYGLARTDESIPRDPGVAQKTMVVAWVVSEGAIYSSRNQRAAEGTPQPGKTRMLGTGFGEASATRLDAVTLRMRSDKGFFDQEMQQLMRGPSRPFHGGDVVALSNMKATVTETTQDGRPKTVVFRFASPLESPEWLWMRGDGFRLASWSPPAIGKTIVLPAASF